MSILDAGINWTALRGRVSGPKGPGCFFFVRCRKKLRWNFRRDLVNAFKRFFLRFDWKGMKCC